MKSSVIFFSAGENMKRILQLLWMKWGKHLLMYVLCKIVYYLTYAHHACVVLSYCSYCVSFPGPGSPCSHHHLPEITLYKPNSLCPERCQLQQVHEGLYRPTDVSTHCTLYFAVPPLCCILCMLCVSHCFMGEEGEGEFENKATTPHVEQHVTNTMLHTGSVYGGIYSYRPVSKVV